MSDLSKPNGPPMTKPSRFDRRTSKAKKKQEEDAKIEQAPFLGRGKSVAIVSGHPERDMESGRFIGTGGRHVVVDEPPPKPEISEEDRRLLAEKEKQIKTVIRAGEIRKQKEVK